jgi:putative restriction endonuclease
MDPDLPIRLAAFDRLAELQRDANIVGIRPDLRVEVSESVLQEVDGPMLQYGLQAAHGRTLSVPRRPDQRPKPEFLEERYEEFCRAS